jgi:PiT family inorganic phosphate transporter
MLTPQFGTIAVVVVALIFGFLNGFQNSANIVATMISSRAMRPRRALVLTAVAHFCAPFIFGVAVATAIGKDVVNPQTITVSVVMAAALSAIGWNLITWFLGLPSSSTHALVAGIVGAVTIAAGFDAIQRDGLLKVIFALAFSPLLGLTFGYIGMKLILFLARGASPRINWFFKRAQVLTAVGLALSQGTNDAQKTMGIVTMGLVAGGFLRDFAVPWWVVALSACAISLGIASGGWRIIKTLGTGLYRLRPVDGFVSQGSSATVILGAALLGGPVSATQVVSSSIMGTGSAQRVSMVRWGVVGEILTAWIMTIPISALGAALLYHPISHFLGGT